MILPPSHSDRVVSMPLTNEKPSWQGLFPDLGPASPKTAQTNPQAHPVNLKPWQEVVECVKCGDKLWSRYNGEFRKCTCGAIAIDSTLYYTRYCGNRGDFKHITNNNDS